MLTSALLLLISALFLAIIVAGVMASAYYFRNKYFAISERMHNAIPLIDAGRFEEARKILSDH